MNTYQDCGTIDGWRRHQALQQEPCGRCEPVGKAYFEKVAAMRGGRALRAEGRARPRMLLERPSNCPLSEREWEVALLAARGAANPRIAADLSISPHTVKTHIRSSLAKLGVTNRSELAVMFYRRGWLPPDLTEGALVPVARSTFAGLARLVHLTRYGRFEEARELARQLAPVLPPPRTVAPDQKGGSSL
jgi:DNA-binding CsgD family transcriptional regulator